VVEITGFVGRDHELSLGEAALAKGNNLLVTGRAGIGKSAFLRTLYERLSAARACLWVPEGNMKAITYELARQVHALVGLSVPEDLVPQRYRMKLRRAGRVEWEWINRAVTRMPARESMELVARSLKDRNTLVFIESLEVPPSQAEFFTVLLDEAQVAAAMDDTNRRVRIERLLWRFRERVELKPLPASVCRAIAEHWLASRPVRFESNRVREAFLRAVEQDSGGVPAAIRGMLEAAFAEAEVTRATVRAFTHKAGVRYLDMTPTLVLGLMAVVAGRYIASGTNSNELYILSGIGIALFIGVRLLMFRLK
jgi:ABC-type iron transport system FetAB ATPase subunit